VVSAMHVRRFSGAWLGSLALAALLPAVAPAQVVPPYGPQPNLIAGGAVTGAIKSNGSSVFSQAACADLSNGATGCSTATGTSGATIPLLNAANTWSNTQSHNSGTLLLKGAVSGTTTLNAATNAGSTTLTLPAGTTDFTATGGASQVVKQASAGGAFTVAQLAPTDLTITPAVKVNLQLFTATGTYTPSAGILYAIAECIGGGGGGGGAIGGATSMTAGGGGGAGSYSRVRLTAAQIGASLAVTIPAAAAGGATGNNDGANGGDVTVTTLCVGKAGTGGGGGNFAGTGGPGGIAGTGDLTTTGQPGQNGTGASITTVTGNTALGGATQWGGPPGPSVVSGVAISGAAAGATSYGAGGNGGATDGTASTAAGGNGAKGVVLVTEFLSQ